MRLFPCLRLSIEDEVCCSWKLRTGIVGGPFWFKGRKGGFLIHAVHRIHQLQRISLEEWKDAGRERTAGSCWKQEPRFSLAPKASWNDESAKPAGFPSRLPGLVPNLENRFLGFLFFLWVYLVPSRGEPQETRIPVKGTTEHIFLLIRRSEVPTHAFGSHPVPSRLPFLRMPGRAAPQTDWAGHQRGAE